jgi:hypothetical protein
MDPDDGHHLRGADPLVAKEAKDGGSRIAIIMNGSPLFTGDATAKARFGDTSSKGDPLEALIALPLQLFYNTGIATYVMRRAPQPRACFFFSSRFSSISSATTSFSALASRHRS